MKRNASKQNTAPVGARQAIEQIQVRHLPTVGPPETFRLPKNGVDQHFGCTRSFYYNLEKRGLIRLIRLRDQGKVRGITLVPYAEMKRFVEEAKAE